MKFKLTIALLAALALALLLISATRSRSKYSDSRNVSRGRSAGDADSVSSSSSELAVHEDGFSPQTPVGGAKAIASRLHGICGDWQSLRDCLAEILSKRDLRYQDCLEAARTMPDHFEGAICLLIARAKGASVSDLKTFWMDNDARIRSASFVSALLSAEDLCGDVDVTGGSGFSKLAIYRDLLRVRGLFVDDRSEMIRNEFAESMRRGGGETGSLLPVASKEVLSRIRALPAECQFADLSLIAQGSPGLIPLWIRAAVLAGSDVRGSAISIGLDGGIQSEIRQAVFLELLPILNADDKQWLMDSIRLEEDPAVMEASARCLGTVSHPEVLRAMQEKVRDSHGAVRAAAAAVLIRSYEATDPFSTLHPVEGYFRDNPPYEEALPLLHGLTASGEVDAGRTGVVTAALDSADPRIVLAVLRLLGEVQNLDPIRAKIEALSRESQSEAVRNRSSELLSAAADK